MDDNLPGVKLTAKEWNKQYSPGQRVLCHNGEAGTFETRTVGDAWSIGFSTILNRETSMVKVVKDGREIGWCLNFVEVIE